MKFIIFSQRIVIVGLIIIIGSLCCLILSCNENSEQVITKQWTEKFDTTVDEFSFTGTNPYFILQPGYRLILKDDDSTGGVELTITVLDETMMVGNIETRVVEERETENGELIEVSRNYFAISKKTNSVFYFGEAVDIYKEGEIVGHEGTWVSGEKGAKFGLMMPGIILLGARFYQEIAPGVAMDRAEIAETGLTVETEAGVFQNCIKTEETNALKPHEKEYKIYAPGVGLIMDEDLKLVEYGFLEKVKG